MKKNVRIAIAQINCTVGDLDGNAEKIIACLRRAESLCADIIAFPELAITGYPPEDLLLKPKFVSDNLDALKKVAKHVNDAIAVVGFVGRDGKGVYNSAAVIHRGSVAGIYNKIILPNYGVFDEKRYFMPGSAPCVFKIGDIVFGVNICEDIWHNDGPLLQEASLGARLIININSSPYHAGKVLEREAIARNGSKANKVCIAYANMVGGQDEIVFDGQSMLVSPEGKVTHRAEAFGEDLLVADIEIESGKPADMKNCTTIAGTIGNNPKPAITRKDTERLSPSAEIYRALVLGLKDYAAKNGFAKALLGLSGGIDSSLVAVIAADALGRENVTGIFMPTRYSSEQSELDAKKVADNLGIKYSSISIDHIYKLYLMAFEPHFAGKQKDLTEENLQARIRGNILMALSNKFGWLVLTTGNKSEMSTGYATLYGDMAGGLAVIKDVPKTLVYKLAAYRNSISKAIPDSVIKKEPTAELRHDQKDRDTLPPYDVLDPIIKAYVEEDKSPDEIAALGFEKEVVAKVIKMVDKSEYKRRQSPPGIKITPKAFGKDRRMPITNKYS
ncbi:MAG: NAD+ synthase [Candidatus Omnitrophica bacterium]|nr:NAD+ synthase [Candidatus Omnitrophota bacterium]